MPTYDFIDGDTVLQHEKLARTCFEDVQYRLTHTVPCKEELPCPPLVVSISGKVATNASPVNRLDITPWS